MLPFDSLKNPSLALSNIWIKICGITREEDAASAVMLGASAIGLVFFAGSARGVTAEDVLTILPNQLTGTKVFGLFVNPSAEDVRVVLATARVDCLQFHGEESEAFCASFNKPYMKAFRVKADANLESEIQEYSSADLILLDTYDEKVPGGTGKSFDWTLAESIRRDSDIRLVLAGGLNPSNVSTAVQRLHPFGIDVSSGVESAPRLKDFNKMKKFIEGARSV